MDCYQQMARELFRSSYIVALTSAGLPMECGLPSFQIGGGFWTKYDPLEYGHIGSFRAEPASVWEVLREMDTLISEAQPNPAYFALAELERRGLLKSIITHNIDNLHHRAGSRNVIEFNGSVRTLRCDKCGERFEREAVSLEVLPPLCPCGGPLRPDFVFLGEGLPLVAHDRALGEIKRCDMLLVIGTSITVTPASFLPYLARLKGAYILVINLTQPEPPEDFCDFCILEPAGEAFPALLAALDEIESSRRVTE